MHRRERGDRRESRQEGERERIAMLDPIEKGFLNCGNTSARDRHDCPMASRCPRSEASAIFFAFCRVALGRCAGIEGRK
jgi:hypothetical protein